MQTLVFANWKGGVGKTTSVANVGAVLAERGHQVLLVDLDPQANLTEGFGLLEEPELAIGELLGVAGPSAAPEAIVPIEQGLDLLPTSDALADLAWQLVGEADYQERLRRVLDVVRDRYAYALIDTPPGIGLWSGLALLSGDAVVIPTRPHDADVMATGKLCDYIEEEIRPSNPGLLVLGALVTQAQTRWRLFRTTQRSLQRDEIDVLATEIPVSVAVGAAPRTGRPIVWLEPDGRPAAAYRRVTDELLARLAQVAA